MEGYISPTNRQEVYAEEMKPARDAVVFRRRQLDNAKYDKYDPRSCCDTKQMECNRSSETVVRNKVEKYRHLYGDFTPQLLDPANFRILHRNNIAYKVGHGAFGTVFLAQETGGNGELVAIKGFLDTDIDGMVKECGFFHKAQQVLSDDNFEKAYLRGFLKIRKNSEMAKHLMPYMCVISLAGITKGVPIKLSLDVAVTLLEAQQLGVSHLAWKDILYGVVLAAKMLYDKGVQHGDYHGGNILIGFYEDRWKLTIIDFGKSAEHEKTEVSKLVDYYKAMALVRKVAIILEWKRTSRFANICYTTPEVEGKSLNWDKVLDQLMTCMNKDYSSVPWGVGTMTSEKGR